MTAEHVIEVRGLRSVFGAQVVHDGLDLDVRRGEVLGVVGGSGSGKSVLLRTIVGLRRPDGGSAKLFDAELAKLPDAQRHRYERRIGLLFQDGALFSSLTVLENVKVPLIEQHALPADLLEEIATLKLRLAGLPADAAHKYPAQLSGGMRKRAGLARAMALDPELLLVDEPSAGLDPITTEEIDDLLLSLKHTVGTTLVVVTHNIPSARKIGDELVMLHEGRIAARGTPQDLERSDDPFVRAFMASAHAG